MVKGLSANSSLVLIIYSFKKVHLKYWVSAQLLAAPALWMCACLCVCVSMRKWMRKKVSNRARDGMRVKYILEVWTLPHRHKDSIISCLHLRFNSLYLSPNRSWPVLLKAFIVNNSVQRHIEWIRHVGPWCIRQSVYRPFEVFANKSLQQETMQSRHDVPDDSASLLVARTECPQVHPHLGLRHEHNKERVQEQLI